MVETVVAEQTEIAGAAMGIIIISLFIAIAMLCLGGWGFISSRKKHSRTSSSEKMTKRIVGDKDQRKTARRRMLEIVAVSFLVATGWILIGGGKAMEKATWEVVRGGLLSFFLVIALRATYDWGFYTCKKERLRPAPEPADKTFPWLREPLAGWSIVGMNHYHQNGEKYLFVAMVKNGRCIVEEGTDDDALWTRLLDKATAAETGRGEDK